MAKKTIREKIRALPPLEARVLREIVYGERAPVYQHDSPEGRAIRALARKGLLKREGAEPRLRRVK